MSMIFSNSDFLKKKIIQGLFFFSRIPSFILSRILKYLFQEFLKKLIQSFPKDFKIKNPPETHQEFLQQFLH